jgi:hypothetical protein
VPGQRLETPRFTAGVLESDRWCEFPSLVASIIARYVYSHLFSGQRVDVENHQSRVGCLGACGAAIGFGAGEVEDSANLE